MRKIFCVLILILVSMYSLKANEGKKIGIALSGGGALGYAHIGFLQAMYENRIQVDVVAGTSMGAIIGAFYSAGYKPMDIIDLVDKENMTKAINLVKLNNKLSKGFFNHDKFRAVMSKAIPHNSFDSLKIKYYCIITDFNNATYRIIGSGNRLKEYVSASASIPLVYQPVEIDGEQYVDGDLMQHLPVEPLIKEKCDIIIGVDVLNASKRMDIEGIANIMSRTLTLMMMNSSKQWSDKCDFVVKPDLSNYSMLDFDKAQELFDIGYEAGIMFFKNYKLYRIYSF